MEFEHADPIWQEVPQLAAAVLWADGITPTADVGAAVAAHTATARARLATGTEAGLPEVQTWRRVFAAMGPAPTRYRSASEALLRRLRKDGDLPHVHPLVDLCNAVSAASAVPVAAFDLARVTGDVQVRPATGTETYETFAGEVEHPEPGEVVFADGAGQAYARRWVNRQSGRSAVRADTSTVLVVAEAVHAGGADDVAALIGTLAREIATAWETQPVTAVLSRVAPRFIR